MREEKIIETIKKCLALANNNPSEEEAKAAALMIVVPEAVKEAYAERRKSMKIADLSMRNTGFDGQAYKEGFAVGKEVMAQRSLEA